ncbi:MAG: SOS response-associated peptidase [Candidatus Obscuribacterales bacterium]
MCGRYTIAHSHKEIIERFRIEKEMLEWEPRYNIAPSQMVPIIIEQEHTPGQNPAPNPVRILQPSKWGLLPSWAKDPKKIRPMINARAETIAEKPTFRNAFKKRRCLIPADGFYEWTEIEGKKTPVRIRLKESELFAFAGLYEDWTSPEGVKVRTCTIVTVAANETISRLHDRMPAILRPELEDQWLRAPGDDPARLLSLIGPYDDEKIDYYTVSKLVNSPKTDSPECMEPVC